MMKTLKTRDGYVTEEEMGWGGVGVKRRKGLTEKINP